MLIFHTQNIEKALVEICIYSSNLSHYFLVFWRFFIRVSLTLFVWRIFKGTPINCIAKIVARGNAVQISSNFPAKRLSIYRKIFLQHL